MTDSRPDSRATSAMLKALSHPLRRAALRALQSRGSARASDLAADLDVAPNAMSFHLRSLAAAGLIVEDPARATDRRERVWVPADTSVTINGAQRSPDDEMLAHTVIQGFQADHAARAARFAAWAQEHLTDPEVADAPHGMFSNVGLRLTPAEARKLLDRILAVVDEAREAHDPEAPDSHMYEFDILAVDDTI